MNQPLAMFPLHLLPTISDFKAVDQHEELHSLTSLLGRSGLMLGFVSDIWMPDSVHLLNWMQRQAGRLRRMEISTALVVSNAPHTLRGFQASSPIPFAFPLLSDTNGILHERYSLNRRGALLLIDAERRVHFTWSLVQQKTPRAKEIKQVAATLIRTL